MAPTLHPAGNGSYRARVGCATTQITFNQGGVQSATLNLSSGALTVFESSDLPDGPVKRLFVMKATCPGWPGADGAGRVDAPPPVKPSTPDNRHPGRSDWVPDGDGGGRDCPIVHHSHDGHPSHMHQASVIHNECVYNIGGWTGPGPYDHHRH